MSNPKFIVELFTDGACSGNHQTTEPRKAGYGAVLVFVDPQKKEYKRLLTGPIEPKHGETVSNNIAELIAVLQGLNAIKPELRKTTAVNVYSDSQYVVNTFNTWIHKWKVIDGTLFKKGSKAKVANSEVILAIARLRAQFVLVKLSYLPDTNEMIKQAHNLAKKAI